MKLHANDVVPPNGGDKRSTMIGPRKDMRFISRLEMIAVQEIGLAGYDQRMRTRQSHIVPAHMRHLDGRIVPLDQPRSAGNPSEYLMTAIVLTPLSEQLHAYDNDKEGHAAFQHGLTQYRKSTRLNSRHSC